MSNKKKEQSDRSEESQTELDLQSITLEKALKRLEEITGLMDSDAIELEESIELFQEGMELATYCREKITAAEQKVQKVLEDSEGNLTLEDFDRES